MLSKYLCSLSITLISVVAGSSTSPKLCQFSAACDLYPSLNFVWGSRQIGATFASSTVRFIPFLEPCVGGWPSDQFGRRFFGAALELATTFRTAARWIAHRLLWQIGHHAHHKPHAQQIQSRYSYIQHAATLTPAASRNRAFRKRRSQIAPKSGGWSVGQLSAMNQHLCSHLPLARSSEAPDSENRTTHRVPARE